VRELQSLKSTGIGGMGRFDTLVFKKTNINTRHVFEGGDGIPPSNFLSANNLSYLIFPVSLNELVEVFDQNCTRRNEIATNTLRRFVKFLLENVGLKFTDIYTFVDYSQKHPPEIHCS
jgi:hypothetical protein